MTDGLNGTVNDTSPSCALASSIGMNTSAFGVLMPWICSSRRYLLSLMHGSCDRWLEARKNNETILVCYVYVEDILKNFTSSVQDFLYIDGSFIGTISCLEHESNPSIDPLILRTEWYLYAITLHNQGKTDDEIRQGLAQQFNLTFGSDDWTFQSFLAEVEIGSRGGYSRENLKLSFDGLRALFNFYWFQYAAYSIATLDTVNVYTPATAQDVAIEKAYVKSLCKDIRAVIQQALTRESSANKVDIRQFFGDDLS